SARAGAARARNPRRGGDRRTARRSRAPAPSADRHPHLGGEAQQGARREEAPGEHLRNPEARAELKRRSLVRPANGPVTIRRVGPVAFRGRPTGERVVPPAPPAGGEPRGTTRERAM